jgi:hypothetical protein
LLYAEIYCEEFAGVSRGFQQDTCRVERDGKSADADFNDLRSAAFIYFAPPTPSILYLSVSSSPAATLSVSSAIGKPYWVAV